MRCVRDVNMRCERCVRERTVRDARQHNMYTLMDDDIITGRVSQDTNTIQLKKKIYRIGMIELVRSCWMIMNWLPTSQKSAFRSHVKNIWVTCDQGIGRSNFSTEVNIFA